MPLPRILPAPPPYPDDIAASFERIMPPGMAPLGLFRTMANNPRVTRRLFAGSLLDRGDVALRDREIAILRTCARCTCEYEWGVHAALFAQRAGLDEREVAATLEEGVSPVWSPRDASLIGLADALHDGASVSDSAWDALKRHFSDEQALELIALCGYYHAISFVANAARVQPEEFAPRFATVRPACPGGRPDRAQIRSQ